MSRYILLLAALLFSVPYADGDGIVIVQGAAVPGGLSIGPTLSETWTQTGAYTNETVSAWLFSGYVNGQPSTTIATAYLSGPGVALGETFSLSSPFATLVPLFDVSVLTGGTYTLTLTGAGGWLWGPETGQPVTVTVADGTAITMIWGSPLFIEVAGVPMGAGPVTVDSVATDEPDTIVMVVAGAGLAIGLAGAIMLVRSIIRSYKDAFEKDDWED